MTVRSLFCYGQWAGATQGDATCPMCAAPWHMHRRTGLALDLRGCGAPGHWTAGGPPWGVEGRTYWRGACEAQPVSRADKLGGDSDNVCPARGLTAGLCANNCGRGPREGETT